MGLSIIGQKRETVSIHCYSHQTPAEISYAALGFFSQVGVDKLKNIFFNFIDVGFPIEEYAVQIITRFFSCRAFCIALSRLVAIFLSDVAISAICDDKQFHQT